MSDVPPPPQPKPRRRPRARTSSATRVLLVLSMLVALVFLTTGALLVWLVLSVDRGDVRHESYLEVRLRGVVPDAPPRGGLMLSPDDARPLASAMSRGIRAAAEDDRIEGLYLRLDAPQMGWGLAQELRSAIVDFREAGKPCVVYAEVLQTVDYYLASACDRVVLAPGGIALVAGINAEISYFAETFEKLGVEPQFEHVGDFKSGVEPYERTGPSDEAAEAYETLLDGIWQPFLRDVAQGRGIGVDDVQALVDRPPMSASAARARGLVDANAFRDALEAHIHVALQDDWQELLDGPVPDDLPERRERFTPIGEYLKDMGARARRARNLIAVVHAEGPIVSGDGDGGLFGGSVLSDGAFRGWMREAREDDRVKAIVVRINSPGGSALASDMMWREIRRAQEEGKPVVVSMANTAASGGYYIAAPADWIVAHPSSVTGSIGVFGGKLTFAGTYDKIGLNSHQFKRGELSDLLSASVPFSDDGREVFRAFLQDTYGLFLDRVAEGRKLSPEQVHEVAQGRVWTGEQALERGLVDELGGLEVALEKAAELAEVETWAVRRLPRHRGLLEILLDDLASGEAPEVRVSLPFEGAEAALHELEVLGQVLADGGVAAYWPAHLYVR